MSNSGGVDIDPSEYNGNQLVLTASIFLALAVLSVALRAYVRVVLTRSFRADDWLMLAGLVVFILSCAFILAGTKVGLGRHNKALEQPNEIEALKWQALATATYILDMMLIKLSIGIFLLRLATGPVYKWIIQGSLFVIFVWSIVSFFWDLFQCAPFEAQWDYTISNAKCVTSEQVVAAAYAISILTIVTDWLYALLPIPMLWGVGMTMQAKLTVVLILGLGVFASIATLIRLKFLADLNDTSDLLFAGTDAMVWTLVEPGVAITAASLATIRPLLRRLNVRGFESLGRSMGAIRSGSHPLSGAHASQARSNNHSATRKANVTGTLPDENGGGLPLDDLESGHGGLPDVPANARTRGMNLGRFRSQSKPVSIPSREGLESKTALATDQQVIGMAIADDDPNALESPKTRGPTSPRDSNEAKRRSEMYIIEGFKVKGDGG